MYVYVYIIPIYIYIYPSLSLSNHFFAYFISISLIFPYFLYIKPLCRLLSFTHLEKPKSWLILYIFSHIFYIKHCGKTQILAASGPAPGFGSAPAAWRSVAPRRASPPGAAARGDAAGAAGPADPVAGKSHGKSHVTGLD